MNEERKQPQQRRGWLFVIVAALLLVTLIVAISIKPVTFGVGSTRVAAGMSNQFGLTTGGGIVYFDDQQGFMGGIRGISVGTPQRSFMILWKPDRRYEQRQNVPKQILNAMLTYASDYDDVLPPMKDVATVRTALQPYVPRDEIWSNPLPEQGASGRAKPDLDWYQPNPALSFKELRSISSPEKTVAFYEREARRNGGRYVVFLDGNVRLLDEVDWQAAKRKSKIP